MQKLSIPYVTIEDGKKVKATQTAIVASTKSQNVLLRDMEKNDKFPVRSQIQVEEIYVDKDATAKALATAFEGYEDNVRDFLVNHALAALDGACMFARPAVSRK